MSRARINADQAHTESLSVVPHIIPDVLYPSYVASGTSNKLLDGSTSHSGAFGTAQSDGRSYYYTNIAGSKPIKDPRIGAHFGSQRHKLRSIQLLEQETATHGLNVYSVDGREWMRASGGITSDNNVNGQVGVILTDSSSDYLEVTGYFSDVNLSTFTAASRYYEYQLDGGSETTSNFATASVTTPIGSRYVDSSSVVNLAVGATLGIHTIRINQDTANLRIFNIELIAQDTTTTATKSQIQIQPQNVVSYGKQFAIDDTALHYDPFATKTDGTAWTSPSGGNIANSTAQWPDGYQSNNTTAIAGQHNIDTATSLGLSTGGSAVGWVHSGAYYRPYNGGRVVVWVDSTGVIKTSVNMMPPNARSIGASASLTNGVAKANASI